MPAYLVVAGYRLQGTKNSGTPDGFFRLKLRLSDTILGMLPPKDGPLKAND